MLMRCTWSIKKSLSLICSISLAHVRLSLLIAVADA